MCFPFSCLIIKRNYTETSLFMLKLCGKQYLSSCFVQSTALDVIKVLKISRHGLCFQNVRVTKWCVKCLLFNMAAFCPNRTQWMQGVGVLRMNGLVHSLPCCQLCSQCFLMHFSFTEFFSSRFWFFVVSVSLVKCSCSLILSLSHWTAFLRFLRSHFFHDWFWMLYHSDQSPMTLSPWKLPFSLCDFGGSCDWCVGAFEVVSTFLISRWHLNFHSFFSRCTLWSSFVSSYLCYLHPGSDGGVSLLCLGCLGLRAPPL